LRNRDAYKHPTPQRIGSVHAGRLVPKRLMDWISFSLVVSATNGLI